MLSLKFGDQLIPLPRLDGIPLLARDEPPPLADPAADLAHALAHPCAGPSLAEHLAGRRKVCLVLPDATRPLPASLVEGLLEAFGETAKIVRIANGTHRRTTPEEHRQLLGRFFGKVEVGDRLADDPATHAPLPQEPGAPRFALDRAALDCDAWVLMGPASFHYLAGFGGGGKLVAPGLADRATAEHVHCACLADQGGRHPRAQAGVLEGNPLRVRLEEVCRLCPPQFYVVPLLDSSYRPVAIFAGERQATFSAACRALEQAYGIACRRFATVIACAGGQPYDLDFVQAHKAWEMARAACAPGGSIVWVARCPEGLPARHRAFLDRHRTAAAMETALRASFDIAAHTVWAARAKAEQRQVVAVTEMSPDLVAALGMEHAPSLQAALERVPLGDAAVLPLGARFLPVPSGG